MGCWLWFILTLSNMNLAGSAWTLTCIAPQNTTFYLNGILEEPSKQVTIITTKGNVTSIRCNFSLSITNSQVEAIGINSSANLDSMGIIASTDGQHHIRTNSSWKCTEQYIENWTAVGYDDSQWLNAFNISVTAERRGIWKGAQWIWTNDTSQNVYCRFCLNSCKKSLTWTSSSFTHATNVSRTTRTSSFSLSMSPVTTTKPTTTVTSRGGTTIPGQTSSKRTTHVVSIAGSITSDVTYQTNATKSAEGMNSTHQNAANTGAIIGGVLGAFGLILLIALLLFIVCFIKRRNKQTQKPTKSSVENEYHEFTPMDIESMSGQTLSHGETPVGRRNGIEGHHESRNLNRLTLDPSRMHTNGHVIAAKKDTILYSNSNGHDDTYDNFVDTHGTATVAGNDDTILVDNDWYGGDSRVVINNNATADVVHDDTILVDNDLYGDDLMVVKNNATSDVVSDDTILVDNDLYGNTES